MGVVEQIKDRCNIVDVIGQVVQLKKTGDNYKGLCPFHNEKTPSFVVSETKQIFTCFGCDAKGDVIAFVQKYYNLTFNEAVERLAKEYGVEYTARNSDKDKILYEINSAALEFFRENIKNPGNAGYEYMAGRGITDGTMEKFCIGYAEDSWHSLYKYLKGKGYELDDMIKLGLVSKKNGKVFDTFRNRVIFPIIKSNDKVIGFGGRIIGDGKPKYLNSPENSIFKKKQNLYGINLTGSAMSQQGSAILVEGYMDVISVYQHGIENITASLGTALTPGQAKLIKRYTDNVVLSYDTDSAGQKATMRAIDILYSADCRINVLEISSGKDPDEFIKENGATAFRELKQRSFGEYIMRELWKAYRPRKSEQNMIDYINAVIKELNKLKPVEADIYLTRLAEAVKIPKEKIEKEYIKGNKTKPVEVKETLPIVELNLIKLSVIRPEYKLPEDIKAYLSKNENIAEILKAISEDKELTSLDSECIDILNSAMTLKIPPGEEKEMLEECVSVIKRRMMSNREENLLLKISAAEGKALDDCISQLVELYREEDFIKSVDRY